MDNWIYCCIRNKANKKTDDEKDNCINTEMNHWGAYVYYGASDTSSGYSYYSNMAEYVDAYWLARQSLVWLNQIYSSRPLYNMTYWLGTCELFYPV